MQDKSGADKAHQPIQPSPAPRVPRLRWPFTQQRPAQDLAGQAETMASAPDVVIPAFLARCPYGWGRHHVCTPGGCTGGKP